MLLDQTSKIDFLYTICDYRNDKHYLLNISEWETAEQSVFYEISKFLCLVLQLRY